MAPGALIDGVAGVRVLGFRHVNEDTLQLSTTGKTLATLSYTVTAAAARLSVQNLSKTTDIAIGAASNVTVDETAATCGWILQPREVKVFDWPKADLDSLYFVAASGTPYIMVWEERCA